MTPLRTARSSFRHSLSVVLLAALTVASACGDASTASDPEVAFAGNPNKSNTVQVNITGLPAGVAAAVTVNGSGGFSRALTSTTTLSGLGNGSYTATASTVSSGGVTYAP